jgi:hypothetical protein
MLVGLVLSWITEKFRASVTGVAAEVECMSAHDHREESPVIYRIYI